MAFSRTYNFDTTTGDELTSLSSSPSSVICKTSFIASIVQTFISQHQANAQYIRIGEKTLKSGERLFLIEACNGNNTVLGTLVGHLPCPNNCVPPEDGLIGPNNTFEVQHFNDVLAFRDITFLNVHSSIRKETTPPTATHTIYAVTHNAGEPDPHNSPGDPIFTSIDTRP